ncbi:MAG: hypothetical protein IJB86_09570 [Clostridia bacterium]|nr:hypothetical protein [Clostridia bacterium]
MEQKFIRVTAAAMTAVTLLLCASCGGQTNNTDTSSETEEKTYVITTEMHTGRDMLYDGLHWHENSMCAVAYLGKKTDWKKGRDAVQKEEFSGLSNDIFDGLATYDAGGNNVYLFVPRFDQEKINVYTVSYDTEGKPHVTDLLFGGNEPFYLICDTIEGKSNVKVEVLITGVIKKAIFPKRDMNDGTVTDANGFQDITPEILTFDMPMTTAALETTTE